MSNLNVLELNIDLGDFIGKIDFDPIHKVMQVLNWTYSNSNQVPSIEVIRNTAKTVCQEALADGVGCESGGFKATIIELEDGISIDLNFVIECGKAYKTAYIDETRTSLNGQDKE